jgi:tRNA threonylcarbamoyladenosine biosynthesis protein TsaB
MILYIDTTNGIRLDIRDGKKTIAKFMSSERNRQSELLLATLKKMLKKEGLAVDDIKKIKVVNQGGSFTSLRIGIATANALGYAWQIPVEAVNTQIISGNNKKQVMPEYGREPDITIKKKI